jgi:hypothetical protein
VISDVGVRGHKNRQKNKTSISPKWKNKGIKMLAYSHLFRPGIDSDNTTSQKRMGSDRRAYYFYALKKKKQRKTKRPTERQLPPGDFQRVHRNSLYNTVTRTPATHQGTTLKREKKNENDNNSNGM